MAAAGMPHGMLVLFAPRPPLEYEPPIERKKPKPLRGIADYVSLFETMQPPPKEEFETPKERQVRKKREKIMKHEEELAAKLEKYDPKSLTNGTRNPFATLFVGRISFETTEKKLKREFECYGPIKRVRMIYDLNGKPRGYAFIEFEHEDNMKDAYKVADGRKIDGRRVLVDVERGRTVQGWLPRRLGGGRGPPRTAPPKDKGLGSVGALNARTGPLGGSGGSRPSFGGGMDRRGLQNDYRRDGGGRSSGSFRGNAGGGGSYGGAGGMGGSPGGQHGGGRHHGNAGGLSSYRSNRPSGGRGPGGGIGTGANSESLGSRRGKGPDEWGDDAQQRRRRTGTADRDREDRNRRGR
jgi:hypothetical protein